MPSRIVKKSVEGFGIAFVEAASYGIGSIGGKDGGASDAIEHEKTGLICDGNSLEEIYSSINFLLMNKKYLEYGKLAKENSNKFNWNEIIRKYNEILKDLTLWIKNNLKNKPDAVNSAATEYLNIFSLVSIGLMWLKMSSVAHRKILENKSFYKSKIDCANIFFTRILTRIDAYCKIKSGSDTIMNYNFGDI